MKVFCSLFDYEAAIFQRLPAVKLRLSGRTATLIAFVFAHLSNLLTLILRSPSLYEVLLYFS